MSLFQDTALPDVIAMSNVKVFFSDKEKRRFLALDIPGFRIENKPGKSEIWAIMGPSGCGKTTFLRVIGGLITPDQGTVLIKNQDPLLVPTPMVFQNYECFPWRRAIDYAAYPLELKSVPKLERLQRAAEVLKTVGLSGHEYKFPKQLSGGQRQRLAIAFCLISKPPVIIMDEPFASLDRYIKREVESFLMEIAKSMETTIMIVIHDEREAVWLANTIIIMGKEPGRIVDRMEIGLGVRDKNTRKSTDYFGTVNLLEQKLGLD